MLRNRLEESDDPSYRRNLFEKPKTSPSIPKYAQRALTKKVGNDMSVRKNLCKIASAYHHDGDRRDKTNSKTEDDSVSDTDWSDISQSEIQGYESSNFEEEEVETMRDADTSDWDQPINPHIADMESWIENESVSGSESCIRSQSFCPVASSTNLQRPVTAVSEYHYAGDRRDKTSSKTDTSDWDQPINPHIADMESRIENESVSGSESCIRSQSLFPVASSTHLQSLVTADIFNCDQPVNPHITGRIEDEPAPDTSRDLCPIASSTHQRPVTADLPNVSKIAFVQVFQEENETLKDIENSIKYMELLQIVQLPSISTNLVPEDINNDVLNKNSSEQPEKNYILNVANNLGDLCPGNISDDKRKGTPSFSKNVNIPDNLEELCSGNISNGKRNGTISSSKIVNSVDNLEDLCSGHTADDRRSGAFNLSRIFNLQLHLENKNYSENTSVVERGSHTTGSSRSKISLNAIQEKSVVDSKSHSIVVTPKKRNKEKKDRRKIIEEKPSICTLASPIHVRPFKPLNPLPYREIEGAVIDDIYYLLNPEENAIARRFETSEEFEKPSSDYLCPMKCVLF